MKVKIVTTLDYNYYDDVLDLTIDDLGVYLVQNKMMKDLEDNDLGYSEYRVFIPIKNICSIESWEEPTTKKEEDENE